MNPLILYGIFFFLVGACVGSFLNVVIWRLPHRGREVLFQDKRGRLSLSWPPSHCPVCDAAIAWHQNVPVLSWLFLRGKCANCGTSIPIRYPLVELGTAVVFLAMYLAYFIGGWVPGIGNLATDWPPLALHLVFVSALLAASAIDADLFIIPLEITWFLAGLGLVACSLIGPPLSPKAFSIIPALDPTQWWLARPIIGAAAGLLLANVLLALKILPRSFDMELPPPAAGEKPKNLHEHGFALSGPAGNKGKGKDDSSREKWNPLEKNEEPLAPPPKLTRFGPAVIAAIILLALVGILWIVASPKAAGLATLCGGIVIFLIGVLPRDAGQIDVTQDVLDEISSPHVRREILKEILFLAIPVACGAIAYALPFELRPEPWLQRLLGSMMGLLVGGGVVWLIRVGGSLGFGKEAMGMGDAHLMAGVGAIIGAPLAVIAFFMAPFLGILWAIVLKILGKPNVLPYGPWLSVASILAIFLGNWVIALIFMGAPV
jgi:prepilin signal peptidase PulO-like enzyme (type II secretory pathway)